MSRRYWYYYNGTGSDQLPGNYIGPTITQPMDAGGTTAGGIYVGNGGVNPSPAALTPNIKAYLAKGKAFQYNVYPLTGQPYITTRV